MRHVASRFYILLSSVLLLTACGTSSGDSAGGMAARPLAAGWFEIHPEPGVTLRMPNGWRASRDEAGRGPIHFSGPDDAHVTVWPVFLPKDAPQPPPYAVVSSIARSVAGQFNWAAPSALNRSAVRMIGRSQGVVAQATFTYRNSPAGVAGYFYLTAARPNQYASLQPTLIGILQGARFVGVPSKPGNTANAAVREPRYVRWQEPNERAYVIDVPEDWHVSGGVQRPTPLALSDSMVMESPDRQVYFFNGDPNLPSFITPTQMMNSTGFPEGARNGASVVMHYQTPVEFLPDYVRRRFASRCRDVVITKQADVPEMSGPANRQLAGSSQAGFTQHVDVGAVLFNCMSATGPVVGAVQAATYLQLMDSSVSGLETSGIWTVSGIVGYITPEQRAPEVIKILTHMGASKQINQQWAQGNTKLAGDISKINTDTANYTNSILVSGYAKQQASGDELSRQRSNAMLDQVDVIDPATNTQYKVESSANYYWMSPQGTVVGTQLAAQPDSDFREMVQLP